MKYYNYNSDLMFIGESNEPSEMSTMTAPPGFDGYFKWNMDHWECLVGVDYLGVISSNKDLVTFVPATHPTSDNQYWDFVKCEWVGLQDQAMQLGITPMNIDRILELTYTNGKLTRTSYGLLNLPTQYFELLQSLTVTFADFFNVVDSRDLTAFGYDETKNIVTAYTVNLASDDQQLAKYSQLANINTLGNFIGYKFDLNTNKSFVKVFDINMTDYAGPVLPNSSILIAKGINIGEINDQIHEVYFSTASILDLTDWCTANCLSFSTDAINDAHRWINQRYSVKYDKDTLQITEFKQYLFNTFYTVNSYSAIASQGV